MNAAARIRQEQACHATFKRMVRDGEIPDQVSIYLYAGQLIGREIDSLKLLSDCEINALRDRLNGKDNKGLEKLFECAQGVGIEDLGRWMKEQAACYPGMAWLDGFEPATLPLNLQWRLVKLLSARRPSKPRPQHVQSKSSNILPLFDGTAPF